MEKETIPLHKFYMDAQLRVRQTGERYGQALFNHLVEVRPDLSEQVRATDKDPFHMNGPADNYEKWDRFIEFVETNWYQQEY